MAFDMPARQSFVVEIASREDLMNAISLNSAMFNGARIIGPAIAGFLMAKVGIALCFFIDGVSFLAVLAGLFMMRLPPHRAGAARGGPLAQSLEGFRYVWNHVRVRTIFALFAIVGIFGWSYSVLMPAFARDVLHLGEQGYGLLLGASGVGALIGALTTATFGSSISPRKLAFGGVWLFCAMLLIFSFNRNLIVAMLCLAGIGLRHDAFLFHLQHHRADDRAGRNARPGDGDLGADFRRDDSLRQPRGRGGRALRRHFRDARDRCGDLRAGCLRDAHHRPPARRATGGSAA